MDTNEETVRCYECGRNVPLESAILIKGDVSDEDFNEMVEMCLQGLMDTKGLLDDSDFYMCKECEDKLLRALEEILG